MLPAGSPGADFDPRYVPAVFLDKNGDLWGQVLEFFAARIRSRNTREAYLRAVLRFARWCDRHRVHLRQLSPFLVAAYIEEMGDALSIPSVKQHLAAIRMLMDHLVLRQFLPQNPAVSVRGPRYSIRRGKTPVLSSEQTRALLDSIDTSTVSGLRDRALLATMLYSFARISAVLSMKVGDYSFNGRRYVLRLHEKGNKYHEVPAHHTLEAYMDEYLASAGLLENKHAPLFPSLDRRRRLTSRALSRREALAMIKRRARAAGLPDGICNHSMRATGITVYLLREGSLENAQRIANHESPRTTKLYDRTSDEITLDEIERIRF